ncbi:hypothetical protein FB45DRAFT_789176 [Roridomyces roridus]|uniref:Uncharacterized protein n=1 Tax=Roridomyces roridus TaxID=1738132 RepID=A0AAD7C2N4_9AGAR|nr:hypothetical protein FB45DRAFT_789176 [Roridomyces roridus]
MARRRPPPNAPSVLADSPILSKSRHHSQPSVEQPNLGMSPESRYQHNLKVLRRRDPSIISIFDQFTHVCVYHHNGQSWEKNGFEGSMFLYERDEYPPYGFYILNRMGMDDYIQRLYPEDMTGIHGTYLMLRSYPEFTRLRLAQISRSHREAPHKFSDAYSVPDLEKLSDGDKGRAHTVGLWMFPTDAREPMINVMMRLHGYIKQNVPYPEEFRYGPNRPPPPNPHLRTTSPSPPLPQPLTELDKLLAKLTSSVGSAPAAPPPEPSSTSSMTLASLFAAAREGQTSEAPNEAVTPPSSRSGIPLLDSIFASAETAVPRPPPVIHSPTPTTLALSPQILDHDVITTLLGLPPSRSASAASAAYSSSREGDNEYEEKRGNGASDGFSESSTVLDPEAELDEEFQAAGASAGRPLLSVPPPRNVMPVNGARANGKGRAQGDVTPRAPVLVPSPMSQPSGSNSTIRPSQPAPFATGAQLWPDGGADPQSDDDAIVELDFEDTAALSDPDAFRQVERARRSQDPVEDGDSMGEAPDGVRERRDRGKGRKKGKRERAAQARTLQAMRIFQLVDPARLQQLQAQQSTSSSRSASASPPLEVTTRSEAPAASMANGHRNVIPETATSSRNVNGHSRGPLNPETLRESLISTLTTPAPKIQPSSIERNEFVREVLTLFHTDKSFVDTLWSDYMDRAE